MAEFWLIRHAESELNVLNQDYVGGRSSWAELTPQGILQATALRSWIIENDIHFDKVICSPAVRAQQTARYGIPQKIDVFHPAVQEISLGLWEGKLRKEVYTKKVIRALQKDSWTFLPPAGESQEAVFLRAYTFLKSLAATASPDTKIAVITHGYVIKFLLAGLNLVERQNAFRVPIANTSITVLSLSENGHSERVRNKLAHLEKYALSSRKGIYEQ